jgi:thioredoxin:protein disulfide reductase
MDLPPTSPGSPRKPGLRSALRGLALATVLWLPGSPVATAADSLLPPEQAFRFSARALDERTIEARFSVADGYYLYRDKFGFVLEPAGLAGGAPALPPGKVKDDKFFGKVETYRGDVVISLPITAAVAGQPVVVLADSQGCADLGVCYPVNRQKVTLTMPAPGKGPGPVVEANPRKKSWFN